MYTCRFCGREKDPNVESAYVLSRHNWTVTPSIHIRHDPVCETCASGWDGNKLRLIVCERLGCTNLACGKPIYGLGYLMSVCQHHYETATQADRDNAIRYRYAER